MAATVQLCERYGTSPGTLQDNVGNMNFGSTSLYELVPASYPITIPAAGSKYSYDKWFQLKCSGTYNKVDNLQYYMATTPSTGVTLYSSENGADLNLTYITPVGGDTQSTIATHSPQTSDPAGANIPIDGSLSGSFVTNETDYSNYFVFQIAVGSTASPGNMTQLTFTFHYDEQ